MLPRNAIKVVFAGECEECEWCEEPVCVSCDDHYADCPCPGPHQDDLYEYIEYKGELYAVKIEVD